MLSAEFAKRVVKKFVFVPHIFGGGPQHFFGGALVNRHHLRPAGQVWLRFCGWSFIYADNIKQVAQLSHDALHHDKQQSRDHDDATVVGDMSSCC